MALLFYILPMKYYYNKTDDWVGAGEIYICDHPLYNRCTLFQDKGVGLAVIQEHFNKTTKAKWWGSVDPWLAGDLYSQDTFREFFIKNAAPKDENGLYPTVTIRKIMWALRMKPLKKEYWEENKWEIRT